jgi:uncharacterized protein YjbI with pentapeptide repeats
VRVDLGGLDLSGAQLAEADLSRVGLAKADLSHAFLYRADLSRAFLRETDLSRVSRPGEPVPRGYAVESRHRLSVGSGTSW